MMTNQSHNQDAAQDFVLRFTRDGEWMEARGVDHIITLLRENWEGELFINTLLKEAKAKLAKSVLIGGGELPPHTKEYLQSIVDERLAQLNKETS